MKVRHPIRGELYVLWALKDPTKRLPVLRPTQRALIERKVKARHPFFLEMRDRRYFVDSHGWAAHKVGRCYRGAVHVLRLINEAMSKEKAHEEARIR